MLQQYLCGIGVCKEGEGGSFFIGGTPNLGASAFQGSAAGFRMGQLLKCQVQPACQGRAQEEEEQKANSQLCPAAQSKAFSRKGWTWRSRREGLKFIPSVPLHCLNFLPIVLIPSALTVVVCLPMLPLEG